MTLKPWRESVAYRPNKLMSKLIRSQIVLILGGAQHCLVSHRIVRVTFHKLLMTAGLAIAFNLITGDRRVAARGLPQDYVSARACLDGDSAYLPLSELYDRYGFPPAAAEVMVRYNPHPPVAILLTIPIAIARFQILCRPKTVKVSLRSSRGTRTGFR